VPATDIQYCYPVPRWQRLLYCPSLICYFMPSLLVSCKNQPCSGS